jgi:hypothetical protein
MQVFLGHSGGFDTDGNELPRLVYVSREKRPGFQHHKKAGAMNALVCHAEAFNFICFMALLINATLFIKGRVLFCSFQVYSFYVAVCFAHILVWKN